MNRQITGRVAIALALIGWVGLTFAISHVCPLKREGVMKKAELIRKLESIPDDEPLFLLRGQDMVASEVVYDWIERADKEGSPKAKLQEAVQCATAMQRWHKKKVPD